MIRQNLQKCHKKVRGIFNRTFQTSRNVEKFLVKGQKDNSYYRIAIGWIDIKSPVLSQRSPQQYESLSPIDSTSPRIQIFYSSSQYASF